MQTGHDLIVIGGGPAGASCAARAADLGLSVALLEKARFPRPKPCAGGLSVRALPLFRDLPASIVLSSPAVCEIVLSDDVAVTWRGDGPAVVTTRRSELDAWLLSRARGAGALVVERAPARLVEARDRAVVEAGGRRWSAPWLVAADGVVGRTRATLGFPAQRAGGAIYVRVPLTPGGFDSLLDRAIFDLSAVRGGYGWVFPKGDHLSVGVYGARSTSTELRRLLDSFLDREGLGELPHEGPFAFPVPTSAGPVGRGRALLVGDAAGFADPVTGEGIPHAIRSGRIAAECVEDALSAQRDALTDYAKRVRHEVLPLVNEFVLPGRLMRGLGPGAIAVLLKMMPLRRLLRIAAPAVAKGEKAFHVETPHTRRGQ